MTEDETWVHYYEPENKSHESSVGRVWVPESKEVKTQSSAGKVMATVFWDAKSVIMLDVLPKKYNIWSILCKLAKPALTVIREKRRCKLSIGVLLRESTLAKLQWML